MRALAQEHLPAQHLEKWLALLRPAVQLVPAAVDAEIVGRVGGLPKLPRDLEWPTWAGHGPLAYIAEVHSDRLATFPLDIALPSHSRLLFFYFDGSFDNHSATVGTWNAESLQGARVLCVPDADPSVEREAPEGVMVYPERHLAGRTIMTSPGWEHPDLAAAFKPPGGDDREFLDHPVNADDFQEALHERHPGPLHQIGGYADPVQGPIESEVAHAALGNAVPYGDPRVEEEAKRWELLLQIDTDDELDMMWGDAGVLYWMIRNEDGPDERGAVMECSFTWQCG